MRKQMLRGVIAAAAIIGVTQVALSGVASATYPGLVAATECLADGQWKATYTASSDTENYSGAPWEITSPANSYTPAGVLDSTQTATRVVVYPADQTSATETITVNIYLSGSTASGTKSVSVTQPDGCELPGGGEWCSPGYWRQPHHLDSWEATGISPDELYEDYFGETFTDDPTLLEVLQNPQRYNRRGTDAFNKVGDLLSGAHPGVDFDGERVENCPLN